MTSPKHSSQTIRGKKDSHTIKVSGIKTVWFNWNQAKRKYISRFRCAMYILPYGILQVRKLKLWRPHWIIIENNCINATACFSFWCKIGFGCVKAEHGCLRIPFWKMYTFIWFDQCVARKTHKIRLKCKN